MVDARNAFGSPGHNIVLNELHKFCAERTLEWFRTFLTGRSFYVEMNGERSDLIALPPAGVSQGTGPGPVLFNVMYNMALFEIEKEYNTVAYADDLVVCLSAKNEKILASKTCNMFNTIDAALAKIDVKTAPEKMEAECA